VRFWDSSALVPLLVSEPSSPSVTREYERDPDIVAWWATDIECASALARLERDSALDGAAMSTALRRLDLLAAAWQEIQPTTPVRRVAMRLLRVHPLRAADALQLGAAVIASENEPSTLRIVTLDDRLAQAADREGFSVTWPENPNS
jgi:predicted nucleic acid-binding protein